MPRIDRYLWREILVPFGFSIACVVAIVFLFQLQRLASAAVGFGLNLGDVLVIVNAALPPFLVLALPLAALMSILIGLGRLSADLELTALSAAGVSPLRLARVPLLLGAAVSALCLPIAHWGEPHGLDLLYERLVDVGLRNITSAIRPGVFNERFDGVALYAERVEGGRLHDVLLYDARDAERPALVLAAEGRLEPRGAHDLVLRLARGEIHLAGEERAERYDRVRFEQAELGIDTERELIERTRFVSSIQRMKSAEMRAKVEELGPESSLGRRIEKTYHRRFAFPSMAFVFALFGAAIGLGGDPRARARSAVLAMLVVVAYYLLTRVGDWAVVVYPGTPALAAYGPNALFLLGGAAWLSRAGRPR